MYNEDLYIGKRPHSEINPNETVPGEVSDDD